MGEGDKTACRRNCWLTAGAAGVLLWIGLAAMVGFPAGQALILSVIAAGLLGLFLVWAFCTGPEAAATANVTTPSTSEVPRTSPLPAAAPVVPPMAEPPSPSAATPDPVITPVASVTPRPDPAPRPETAAVRAPKVEKPPRAPRRAMPASAVAAPEKTTKAARPASAAGARATGLDAAMGRTKETAPTEAGLLLQPRDGKGDDLKLIVGVGPALERLLNGIGVWHFDQIAAWKAKDIALVDSKMANFKGRITRDGWVKQARQLAKDEKLKGRVSR